jgi:hypothetical protein
MGYEGNNVVKDNVKLGFNIMRNYETHANRKYETHANRKYQKQTSVNFYRVTTISVSLRGSGSWAITKQWEE